MGRALAEDSSFLGHPLPAVTIVANPEEPVDQPGWSLQGNPNCSSNCLRSWRPGSSAPPEGLVDFARLKYPRSTLPATGSAAAADAGDSEKRYVRDWYSCWRFVAAWTRWRTMSRCCPHATAERLTTG